MTIEELNKEYGRPVEEHIAALKSNALHPVYKKWLPILFTIQDVYGHVEQGNISLGKARELTAAIIEKNVNQAQ